MSLLVSTNVTTKVVLQAIWFSASGDLALDAKRDFHDIGALRYKPVKLHDLKHCKAKPRDKLADTAGYDTGILFSTYDLLIAGKTKAPKPKPGSCHVNADHEDAAECGLGDLCEPADIDPAHREFGELQPPTPLTPPHQCPCWCVSNSIGLTFCTRLMLSRHAHVSAISICLESANHQLVQHLRLLMVCAT